MTPAPGEAAPLTNAPGAGERPDDDARRPDFRALADRIFADADPKDRTLARIHGTQLRGLTRVDSLHRDVEAQAVRLTQVERRLERIESLLEELVRVSRPRQHLRPEGDAQR